PDGKALAAYSPADRILRVWDVALGKPTWQTDAPATLAELAFTPDGKTLAGAVTGKEPKIQLWSAGTGQELLSFARPGLHLAFSADGKALAGAGIGNAGGVRVWEVESGREVQQFPIPFATTGALAFGPDDKTLLATAPAGDRKVVAYVWDRAKPKDEPRK